MAGEEEFQLCPNCKAGRLRPTGLTTTSADPQTNRVTNNLGATSATTAVTPKAAKPKWRGPNEQAAISESTNTTMTSNSGYNSSGAISSRSGQGAIEEDKDKGKEGTEEESNYTTTSRFAVEAQKQNPV